MIEQEIKDIWLEFREYAIQKHHLLPDYEPDLSSIVMWEEYKNKIEPQKATRTDSQTNEQAMGNWNTGIIEDGFGGAWSAYCPECGQKSMVVVRPGKVQCNNCE